MCVGRKKCRTLLYNFLISICTKRKQGSDTNKTRTKHKRTARDDSQYSAQKAAIRRQPSWWRPRSSFVVSLLHGRRCGGSHSTTSPTALSLASRTAKRRIPIDDVTDGVDPQLHGRRSGEPRSTTSLTALSPSLTSATQRLQTYGRPRGHQTPCLSRKIEWHATCCDALLL